MSGWRPGVADGSAAAPPRRTLRWVAGQLAAAGIDSPDAEARWLVEHVVEVAGGTLDDAATVRWLSAPGPATGVPGPGPHPGGAAAPPARMLGELLARRVRREPLQLVTGRTWFRTIELACRPGVFIPRPETEVVAGAAIDALHAARRAHPDARLRVVDVGTGTAAIAASIAVEVAGVEVVATDLDPAAVALARHNLAALAAGERGGPLAPGSRVEVVPGDLLAGVDAELLGRLDVLVANPPYLPAHDRGTFPPEVAHHDPDRALIGGHDGHELVDALLQQAAAWLRPGGRVVVEIDERRGRDALTAAARAGLTDARLVADLTGAERGVVAARPA